jgi:hypothetical protein
MFASNDFYREMPKRRNTEIFEESVRFEEGTFSLLRFRAFVLSVFRGISFKRLTSSSADRNKKGETRSHLLPTLGDPARQAGPTS